MARSVSQHTSVCSSVWRPRCPRDEHVRMSHHFQVVGHANTLSRERRFLLVYVCMHASSGETTSESSDLFGSLLALWPRSTRTVRGWIPVLTPGCESTATEGLLVPPWSRVHEARMAQHVGTNQSAFIDDQLDGFYSANLTNHGVSGNLAATTSVPRHRTKGKRI